jgi:hypothetical protein
LIILSSDFNGLYYCCLSKYPMISPHSAAANSAISIESNALSFEGY